jgi:hypothetical protein
MTPHWRALIASALVAVIGTAGLIRAAEPMHTGPPAAPPPASVPAMHHHH